MYFNTCVICGFLTEIYGHIKYPPTLVVIERIQSVINICIKPYYVRALAHRVYLN